MFKKWIMRKIRTQPDWLSRRAHFATSKYTAINTLEAKYFVTAVIWMNYDTNKSAICHHKLANWELVNILVELKVEIEKNYGHLWWTKQYERKKEDNRKWTHNLGIMSTLLFLLEPKYAGGLSFPMNLFQNLK